MTTITGAYVQRDINDSWYELHLQVDGEIDLGDLPMMAYPTDHGTLYVGFNEMGIGRFFHHSPKNETGFGGARFTFRLVDGTEVTVKGPWSSSPSSVLAYTGIRCFDVIVGSTVYAMAADAVENVLAGSEWQVVEGTHSWGETSTFIEPVPGFTPLPLSGRGWDRDRPVHVVFGSPEIRKGTTVYHPEVST